MSKCKTVRLGDYIEQIRGVSYKPENATDYEDETHKPILRAHNIQDSGLNYNNLIYVDTKNIKNFQYIKKGDIVVCASSGSKDLVGKAAQAGKDMKMAFGAFCKVVRPKKAIEYTYLKHYFSSPFYRHIISELSSGANINNLRNEHIDDLQIPLPPLPVQKKIADVLDHVSMLIEKRKEQVKKLDLLVKAQFVEMFGDPVMNPMGWDIKQLGEVLSSKASNGFFAKNEQYSNDGNSQVMWISDVVNRMYSNIDGLKRISVNEIDITKYSVSYGDILFCRSSLNVDGIGKASMVPKNVPTRTLFECHVIRTSLNLSICLPEFIQVLTTMSSFRNQIMMKAKTATMTTISQDGVVSNMIYLPPLSLQNRFAEIVKEIDKRNVVMQEGLTKLELTYKALMQEYFG